MKNRRSLPSPGLLVAMIALVVALVGTAWALPGRNTVNSGDIKPKSVKRSDQALNQRTEWALIELGTNPEIIRQSGGLTIAGGSPENAYVRFGQSMANRAITSTGVYPDEGPTMVGLCGEGADGINCIVPGTDNNRHVYVQSDDLNSRVYLAVLPR